MSIELPRKERDIHIVLGANETGKTTSLTAIEDMLFGIPERSPYNFLHSYENMRIGAVLENGDDCFEFQRRKTRRGMILGVDGNPLSGDERLLAPFLGGADRFYFDRMFNLSHGRLAEGGKVIIEAKDDVGQMLFAAGTGLADLRKRHKQLEEEADRLWAPRKSERRLYYQAQARLEEAQSQQRKHSLTVKTWKTARKNLNDAEMKLQERRKEHEETSIERKKLARIRRVQGAIRQRGELTQEIEALGDIIALAEDAAEQLDQAEQQEVKIKAQIDILTPQLEENRQKLEAITFDEALVQRADEITQLNEQRIAIRSEREDLPKRQDEYRLELESLARLAIEIGWNFDKPNDLIDRIPPRGKIESVRRLLAQHGELGVELRGVRKALEESQAKLQVKTEHLEKIGKAEDVSELTAVLNAVRDSSGVVGRIRTLQGQIDEISESIEKILRSMKPNLKAHTDIETHVVPPKNAVISHRDDVRNLALRKGETNQWLIEARNNLEQDQEALEQRVRYEGVVEPSAIEETRNYRDTLWNLVKTRYIERSEIPVEKEHAYAEALEDLPASLEEAVERADSIADRRFDKAQAAGELAVLAHNITRHETRVRQLETNEATLKAEGEQLDKAWHTLWGELPIEPLAPDVMLEWLITREKIVTLIDRERDLKRQLSDIKREEKEAIDQVHAAMTKVGLDADKIETNNLRVMVEQADVYRREQEAKAEKIVEINEAVRTAKFEVVRRQGELERVEEDRRSWQKDWGKTVAAIDLQCDDNPDNLSTQINVIDEMREHAAAARDLRDRRIATIERDIKKFEQTVLEVTAEMASDLLDGDADTSVVTLNRRCEKAMKLYQLHRELTETVSNGQQNIEMLEETRKAGWTSVQPMAFV